MTLFVFKNCLLQCFEYCRQMESFSRIVQISYLICRLSGCISTREFEFIFNNTNELESRGDLQKPNHYENLLATCMCMSVCSFHTLLHFTTLEWETTVVFICSVRRERRENDEFELFDVRLDVGHIWIHSTY